MEVVVVVVAVPRVGRCIMWGERRRREGSPARSLTPAVCLLKDKHGEHLHMRRGSLRTPACLCVHAHTVGLTAPAAMLTAYVHVKEGNRLCMRE